MKNWNETFRSLNVGLPDDVERLKAAGYYQEAIERIDAYLAEDWTVTQNSPRSQGAEPVGEELPQNPTPHGVEALRDAMLAQREIMEEETGQWPVLLLDDVLSELDAKRQSFVLNRIKGGQLFITCCEEEKLEGLEGGRAFQVKNGAFVAKP